MVRVANSTPMVDLESREKVLRVKRERRLDLPTTKSPTSTTLNAWPKEEEERLGCKGG